MIYFPESSNIQSPIDPSCTVHSHVWIGDDVKIGKNVKIQAFAFIPNGVTIENDVFIGPHVCFTNDPKMDIVPSNWNEYSLEMDVAPRFVPTKTLVKRGARIGANACILAGVTIGEGAIVGMGAVVLRDVPDGETWVGNPAR